LSKFWRLVLILTILNVVVLKPLSEFHKRKDSRDGYRNYCKECAAKIEKTRYETNHDAILVRNREYGRTHKRRRKEYVKQYRIDNPEKARLYTAGQRAKKRGIPCTITTNDIIIPEFCPVLGIKLELGKGKNKPGSPSLDRIKPELGYVPGNVAVISNRANILKGDGTAEEHRKIANWIEAQT
jgi:hypothetical protein